MKASVPTFVATILLLALTAPSAAQRTADERAATEALGQSVEQLLSGLWAPQSSYTNSPHLRKTFRPVAADARAATVEVRSRTTKKRLAFGGVVGPDGWVVTKASQLRGPLACRLTDGRLLDARLVGVDRDLDLAMLKIDAKDLPTLDLQDGPKLEAKQDVALRKAESAATSPSELDLRPGDWLATTGIGRDPIAVGVLSVLPRAIEKQPGFLGVGLDLQYAPASGAAAGVKIDTVMPEGAAFEAGLLPGDLVVQIDSRATASPQELKEAIAARHPGDRVEVHALRGEERVVVVAVLHGWAPNPGERRAYYQNQLGGELSERRVGFPSALQHDTVLAPNECGGPIVNLDGRVVGFNIARAGRTESYALPASEVKSRLLDLMSGRLAPIGEAE